MPDFIQPGVGKKIFLILSGFLFTQLCLDLQLLFPSMPGMTL